MGKGKKKKKEKQSVHHPGDVFTVIEKTLTSPLLDFDSRGMFSVAGRHNY